ncbi:PliI family lysozyme inhibitor of I-type lysozyme [Craterilacuibacter sp.]|uniref:PliI family lysozyme inhibitor of I-type lysozyme n=1 Tax=Craterilacuibacter sp. TaxID=2870909 RepID=UPI003F2D4218
MKTWHMYLLSLLLLAPLPALADNEIRQQALVFKKGMSSTQVKGQLKGYQTIDYQLRARAGQKIRIDFAPSNRSAYFNLNPPGSEQALFIGATRGDHYAGVLPADGVYTLRVYLMRNAARRNETTRYTLKVGIDPAVQAPSHAPAAAAFDKVLSLQGISFHVMAGNEGSLNQLTIIPSGLKGSNAPIKREIDGSVSGAEIEDLNADGSPELYVYVNSAGSGSYGSLVAYAANRIKSLSEISLPDLATDKKLSPGYQGHDAFAVGEGRLLRRFPIYQEGDINAKPTGGMRQIQYRLVPGEAGWQLKADKVVTY